MQGPDDLRALITKNQQILGRKDVHVLLTLPGRWGKRTNARLFGRQGGPSGRIVGEPELGRIIVDFDGLEILKWLDEVGA